MKFERGKGRAWKGLYNIRVYNFFGAKVLLDLRRFWDGVGVEVIWLGGISVGEEGMFPRRSNKKRFFSISLVE